MHMWASNHYMMNPCSAASEISASATIKMYSGMLDKPNGNCTLHYGNFLILRPYHGEHGPKVTPEYMSFCSGCCENGSVCQS
jgi:hypothetical protein